MGEFAAGLGGFLVWFVFGFLIGSIGSIFTGSGFSVKAGLGMGVLMALLGPAISG